MATSEALVTTLNRLLQLDHDAVEACEQAIKRLDSEACRAKLRTFQADHRRHLDELRTCISISHTMAAALSVDADAPMFDHGDTEDKPSPAPNANRISDSAAAANAPPASAAQDTPDEWASFLTDVSARPV